MTFLRAEAAARDHVSLHARRAAAVGYPRIRGAGRQHPFESGPGTRVARPGHQRVRQGTRWRHRHLGHGTVGLSRRSGQERTSERAPLLGLQRRASGRRRHHHRCACHRRACDDLGRLQARRGGVLLLALRPLAAQLAEGRRPRSERVGRHASRSTTASSQTSRWTTRATSTATACCSIPGEERLHPEQDRGIAGPIATVQLANLRRGLQDHQYLTLARKLGLEPLVDEPAGRDRAACLLRRGRPGELSRNRRSVRGGAADAGSGDRARPRPRATAGPARDRAGDVRHA